MLFLPRNSVTAVRSVLLINNTAFLLPDIRIARMIACHNADVGAKW